ncbi:MAG TPA: hypothetical protein VF655_07340, partial [Allosphingosinicella sp.]
KLALAAAAVLSMPAFAAAQSPNAPAVAPPVERSIASRAWAGKFLQRDWTFEFAWKEGKLQGRYMRSDGGKWLPLNDLLLAGRSISFAIESKPKISFALKLGASDQDLSGTVTLEGVAMIPFSATPKP